LTSSTNAIQPYLNDDLKYERVVEEQIPHMKGMHDGGEYTDEKLRRAEVRPETAFEQLNISSI